MQLKRHYAIQTYHTQDLLLLKLPYTRINEESVNTPVLDKTEPFILKITRPSRPPKEKISHPHPVQMGLTF